ncbi:hypothetical protein [Dietzia alimentaria]|uniref:hypothetical protein n=1 Tax=Dietzia alimentaria TaxID=665550 RepID=UPI00029A1E11|nr:hypothetical protein [Dietzia alimentaria]
MTEDDRSAASEPKPAPGPEPTQQFPTFDGPPAAYSQWESAEAWKQSGHQPPGYPHPGYPQPGQQYAGAAAAIATNSARRVKSMPWQERVMRLPGALAVLAGLLTLMSCLFSWWAMFDRSMGEMVEYTVAPFRGVSASSGSRWGDMAMMNSLSGSDLDSVRAITISIGILLVVAALCLVAGGVLVAIARAQLLGASLMLLGTVFLGYARIPSEMVGNLAEATTKAGSALTDPTDVFSDLFGSIIPEARFGLGLSTFAMTLMTLALLIYLGMIIYRETIRIRRWMA